MNNQKNSEITLVVDLDGTLIQHDMLFEAFWSVASKNPFLALRLILGLRYGVSYFKERLANSYTLDPAKLSYNQLVLEKIKEWRKKNARVVLASASSDRIVTAIAKYLGLFDEVHASDQTRNLKGKLKASFLEERYGAHNFDYIGNSLSDIPVWEKARQAIIYNPGLLLRKKTAKLSPEAEYLVDSTAKFFRYIKALRPTHWLKNSLIFLPAIIAIEVDGPIIYLQLFYAFIAFSLIASSGYLLNDLFDLESDRSHHRRKLRPIAAGEVPLVQAMILAMVLTMSAFILAFFSGNIEFLVVLITYFILSTTYSFYFKSKLLVDVFFLGTLYTLRILAGAATAELTLTVWLLAFSFFIFLSLATIKRLSELVDNIARNKEALRRPYEANDIPILKIISLVSGYIAILVLALHIATEPFQQAYPKAFIVWAACPVILYWVTRLVFLADRGQMEGDPFVFAIRDNLSYAMLVTLILLHIAAKYL